MQIPREAWDQIGVYAAEQTRLFEEIMGKWEGILNSDTDASHQLVLLC